MIRKQETHTKVKRHPIKWMKVLQVTYNSSHFSPETNKKKPQFFLNSKCEKTNQATPHSAIIPIAKVCKSNYHSILIFFTILT